jgi:hypothetical protein
MVGLFKSLSIPLEHKFGYWVQALHDVRRAVPESFQ